MMLVMPVELEHQFSDLLANKGIPQNQSWNFRKWLRYYLDFCHKYRFSPDAFESLGAFLQKLGEKKQTHFQSSQAADTVRLSCRTSST